jgi:transketolase
MQINGKHEAELNRLRLEILQTAHLAQEGHVPSALSILEPILSLYNSWDFHPSGVDTFILSKGHGCLALYVVLAEKGFIQKSDLDSFCKYGSVLGGHPDSTKINGVAASTGSLGHGFPLGVGMAYAKKYLSKDEGRVFVLLGDGECNEGSVWEAAMLVNHHNLGNLVTWVDFNHSGDRAVTLGDLASKWKSFGFEVEVIDGHDIGAISKSIGAINDRPKVIIGNSIKGHGVSFMENDPAWHHSVIDEETLRLAKQELT